MVSAVKASEGNSAGTPDLFILGRWKHDVFIIKLFKFWSEKCFPVKQRINPESSSDVGIM